jgi:hypothetical protein
MTSRRNVLFLIGGGTVVAASAVGGFIAMNGPSTVAREPWRRAGQYDEFRRRALSYALLAPNPHNRQPWKVRLEGDDALTLYCDLARRLPVTDPYDRQIVIGCGAFLELLSIAAAEDGYRAEIVPFPEGEAPASLDSRPVARVRFIPDEARPDPLFAHILARRSNKETYEPRDVPEPEMESLLGAGRVFGLAAGGAVSGPLVEQLRDLTWKAQYLEMTTPKPMQESVDLMRIGGSEVAANPDGIELEGPLFAFGKLAGVINRRTLADPASEAFRQGVAMYEGLARSARAFGWLTNANAGRSDQIDAGRAYVRLNLKATELGLAVHPWSQSLQEYPEMADLYREVHGLVGGGQRVQMLFRVGYSRPVAPTPRWGLESHLV